MEKDLSDNKNDLDQKVAELENKKFHGKCNKCEYEGDGQMVISLENVTLAAVCIKCFAKLVNHTCGVLVPVEPKAEVVENRQARRKK